MATFSPAPLSILVVEDDPAQKAVIEEFLVFMGHEVLSVNTAEQAIELLAANEIAVLIADVNLPGMSGIDLARHAFEHDPAIEIFFTTGHSSLIPREQPFPFTLIAKPFHFVILQGKLVRLCLRDSASGRMADTSIRRRSCI